MSRLKTARTAATTQESLPCAFCHGRGTDPFSVMSELSVCGACQGTGRVLVSVPHTRCVYCGGDGSYKTYRCPVCCGAGGGPRPRRPDCHLPGMPWNGRGWLQRPDLPQLPWQRRGHRERGMKP